MAFLLAVLTTTASATDWPNWRGPNYNGISDETNLLTNWPKEGPKVLWKASIGMGFSAISVADGKAYAMGNVGKETDVVYCFDAETGKELWTHRYDQDLDPKYYEGGTLASPTVDGDKVYTISKDGKLFCLDTKDGDVIWNKDLIKELKIERTTWGYSGSPLVLDDLLILNAGRTGLALNKKDGSVVWKNETKPGGYATPVAFTSNGKKCIAMFGYQELLGLEAPTGKELWRHTWKTKHDVHAADPIIIGDKIFISSGYTHGCALLQIGDDNVSVIWENSEMRNKMNASVVWKEHIYGVDERKDLRCLDLSNGKLLWSQLGFGQGSLSFADGKLIVMGAKGNLVIAEATPEGYKPLAQADVLTGKCWTVPVLANGRLYVRNSAGDMLCLDVKGSGGVNAAACSGSNDWPGFRGADRMGMSKETGLLKKWPQGGLKETWSVEGLGSGFASVSIADGLIYTTGMDKKNQGTLFAFDLKGKPIWSQQYGPEWKGSSKGTRTTPTVDGNRLYIMSGQGKVACYDAKSGERKWYIDTLEKFKGKNIGWGISESVLIDGEKLICTPGGENASVVALDKMTGKTIWTSKDLSELSAYCCPVIHKIGNNRVLITMLAKSIVALNPDNGDLYWQIPNKVSYDIQAVIPLYHNNMLYISNGYGKGGKMFDLSNDGTEYKLKWTEKNLDCHHGGVVLIDGDIHGSNDDGAGQKGWVRLDWQTGKLKTIDKLVGKGSVIFADGLLYCYGEKGTLGLVNITDTGYELISSFKITKGKESHWAHPAIANKVLYIRHGDVLMAFDIKG